MKFVNFYHEFYRIPFISYRSLKMKSHSIFTNIVYVKFIFIILFTLLNATVFAQALDWLKQSNSEHLYTNHSFYTSTVFKSTYFFAGDFNKDLTIGDLTIDAEDDSADAFIVKLDENGISTGLWHLKSSDYIRINKIEVNPISESLIVTGHFNKDLSYDDITWTSLFFVDGFVMSININDGTVNWMNRFEPQSEFSFASGSSLAIDNIGNIFVGLETTGVVDIANETYSFEPETGGVIIAKFNSNGEFLQGESWANQNFEGWIDINDMSIDDNNNVITVGSTTGQVTIADSLFNFSSITFEPFIIKQSNDLHLEWLKSFSGMRCHIRDVYIDGNAILLSVQYNQFLNVDGDILIGSGSWGDMAIISLDEQAKVNWAKNFTLSENAGVWGVYGDAVTKWNNKYYIAGMYQGDVVHDGSMILDNEENGNSYQYPFIISLDKDGTYLTSLGFEGSSEPGRITCISSDDSHLLFGGDFSGEIAFGDSTVSTINTALFFGALKLFGTTGIDEFSLQSHQFSIYPSITSNHLLLNSNAKINGYLLYSVSGTLLFRFDRSTNKIDVSDLIPGTYFLVAKLENGEMLPRKFIVK